MTKEQHTEDQRDDEPSGPRRFVPSTRSVVALIFGVLLGAVCTQLPESVRAPCEVLSRVLPAACGGDSQK